jgi:Flp pilus assembly protein TadG
MSSVGSRKFGPLRQSSRLLRSRSGQSLIELALVIPMAFLLIVNVVNFGALIYALITVSNAARTGAAYMSMGPASAGGPVLTLPATVAAVVKADLASLPHAAAATVSICSNSNGTREAPYNNCTVPINPATGAVYADPEPNTSVVGTVQVQYTYCPLIPSWSFPALGIYTTLPACTVAGGQVTGGGVAISRVAAMRIMQ